MPSQLLSISFATAVTAVAMAEAAHAQGLPNLAGTYRCVPEPSSCRWQGKSLAISQTGSNVQINVDKDEFAAGKVTSNITVSAGPPFNAEGRILPDHSIEWSNGTKWTKQ